MPKPIDPFTLNQRLARGVNIIGYDPIWQDRQRGRIQAKHFRLIRAAGFSHVRINLHPFHFMEDAAPYTIAPAWLETLDWAVAQSLENNLLAILDMHEFGALGEDPAGLKPKFLAVWRQLASRFQGYPETVLFELLNEPNKALTASLWNDYLKEPYAIIRQANPNRCLVIGPSFWNNVDYLDQLQLPENDPNLIVTVHYYKPMSFTHQGAPWTEHVDQLGIQFLDKDKPFIHEDFARVDRWAKQYHHPVYLGEFGAYDKAEMASRVRYTDYVARLAESFGWSWGYWQFDSDFIAYNIDQDHWVQPILNALIPAPR